MSGWPRSWSRLSLRRRSRASFYPLHQVRPYVTPANAPPESEANKADLKPTPAQFLRFALTKTTQTPGASYHDQELDQRLEIFFSKPHPGREDELLSSQSPLPDQQFFPMLKGVTSVVELQVVIENYVTSAKRAFRFMHISPFHDALLRLRDKHEYAEILAAIGGIWARVQSFKTVSTRNVLLSGMRYACLAFSAPALRHYVEEYSKRGYGVVTPRIAWILVRDLSLAFRLRKWENPVIDKNAMLKVIAGVDLDGSLNPTLTTLYSLFARSRSKQTDKLIAEYATLLGQLGDTKRLSNIWYDIQNELREGAANSHYLSARACLWAFIDSGNPQTAVYAARDILSHGDLNEIITLPLWKRLLEHDETGLLWGLVNQETTEELLNQELRLVEQRLGVKWSGGKEGRHFKAGDLEIWSVYDVQDSLRESTNGTANLEDIQRLLEEITSRGSSKSKASLAVIADLLNEYEGLEVPLGTRVDEEHGSLEYAWFPQSSPIEFSNDPVPLHRDMAVSWTPSSLGLIRARLDYNGVPLKGGRPIHLMQLGYLAVRRGGDPVQHDNRLAAQLNSWTSTGHVIAWDRTNERFMIIFMGKGYGVLDPCLLKPASSTYLSLFSAVVDLKRSTGLSSDFAELLRPERNAAAYWIDVDPGSNLNA